MTGDHYTSPFFVNDWDGRMDFRCPKNYAVSGMYSEHNNKKEDRRWKFRCSRINRVLGTCTYTWYINQYDGPMDYSK